MINGYKTYISSALIVLFAILYVLGILNAETFLKLFAIFAGTGLASLRHAVAKISAK